MDYGPMAWEYMSVQSPYVSIVTGKYKMWYIGISGSWQFSIGQAEGPMASCVPVYYTGCENGDGFDDFKLEGIQNTGSGCASLDGTGWSNYHNMVTELHSGNTYDLSVMSNNNMQYFTVWVDWDMDGEYEPEEKVIDNELMVNAGVSYTFDFVVPDSIVYGTRYLRARTNYNAPCDDPCANYYYGETEEYMLDIITGIGELEENNMTISPNPSSQEISISVDGKIIDGVTIYSLSGQQVFEIRPQDESIDISTLKQGMYIVEVTIEGRKVRRKLLVE